MRRSPRSLILALALTLSFGVLAAAQDVSDDQPAITPNRMPDTGSFNTSSGLGWGDVVLQVNNGGQVPMFNYKVISPVDGGTYQGVMVGKSPLVRGARTTSIPTVVIPVTFVMAFANRAFDPTFPDLGCLAGNTGLNLTMQSPLLNNSPAPLIMNGVNVGATQYVDGFRRAEFWNNVAANGAAYHLLLGPVAVAQNQVINVPSNVQGNSFFQGNQFCGNPGQANNPQVNLFGRLGVVDINWFDPIAHQIIQNLGIPPSTFPLFLFYATVLSDGQPGVGGCCILGYHFLFGPNNQTYGVAEFERQNNPAVPLFNGVMDTSVIAHEVGEWYDDPLGNNLTPAWGHIGQQGGCQNNLEVGDPLSGTLFPPIPMPNGYVYHAQELAFFSWFYRQAPSIGSGGKYSNNGTFTTGAGAVCAPPS